MDKFIFFQLFYTAVFIIMTVTMHEDIHAANCEYFGGEVVGRGFNHVECLIVENDLHRFADSLNEMVMFITMAFFFITMMILTYINIHIDN